VAVEVVLAQLLAVFYRLAATVVLEVVLVMLLRALAGELEIHPLHLQHKEQMVVIHQYLRRDSTVAVAVEQLLLVAMVQVVPLGLAVLELQTQLPVRL
jgi:hypothetical protein